MLQTSLEQFIAAAKTGECVAVHAEVLADRLTPVGIFESLQDEMRHGAMLESGMQREEAGRHSFLAFDAMAELRVKNGKIIQRIGSLDTELDEPPFTALRKLMKNLSAISASTGEKMMANAVGFLGYDGIRFFENIPDRHPHSDLPDLFVKFYRTTLRFDHQQHKLSIMHLVDVENNAEKSYETAVEKIKKITQKINTPVLIAATHASPVKETSIEPDVSDENFIQMVERAKKHIVQGDVFQVVLSRCFTKKYTASPFDIYRALRRVNPSPYMFYLSIDEAVIVGASPERMVSVQDGIATVNPIAGTRPRHHQEEDAAMEKSLLNDPKELAEHMMLVDLARNDLGAVSEPGSVKVTELLRVKHFSHVSHLTSLVTGKLRKNLDALDALAATFPAGTLSGAPKIRAMEIIDELETSRRGVYGGAIFRLDKHGNLDSCIAIRMAVLRNGVATVRAGAGIVYDSNPKTEADETSHKAKAMLTAIALADRGFE